MLDDILSNHDEKTPKESIYFATNVLIILGESLWIYAKLHDCSHTQGVGFYFNQAHM